MKKLNLARREFLLTSARSLGFLGVGSLVMEQAISSFLMKAFAQEVTDRHYVHVSLAGAPPRWLFDLILKPSSSAIVAAGNRDNPNAADGGFGTTITPKAGGGYNLAYSPTVTIAGKPWLFPPVWRFSSGARPFTSLLQNCHFIRGVDMEINSHDLSNGRQVSPIIGGLSLNGVTADKYKRPIPSVAFGGMRSGTVFRSESGYSALRFGLDGANPLTAILSVFDPSTNGRLLAGDAHWLALKNQALEQIDLYSQSIGISNQALTESYESAIELIRSRVYELQSSYDATFARYDNLVRAAIIARDYSGIFPATMNPSQDTTRFAINGRTAPSNLWDMLDDRTKISGFAQGFAVSEILLKNKITSNLVIGTGGFTNLNLVQGRTSVSSDHHTVGALSSTILSTVYYRALLSCLVEFKAALGSEFAKTVIHISSEFNRNPRGSGTGSDHAPEASNVTLISGLIQQAGLVGNIRQNSGNNNYPGGWGVAAPIRLETENRPINVNDIARTVSTLLMHEKQVTQNGHSLIAVSGSTYSLKNLGANNVA